MYPEAVHFRDKNSGKLEEIDNTLMPIQDSACGVYLTNRNNDELKVEFHGAQDVQPKVVDFARPQESKRDRRRAVLAQLEGEVVYEDIFPDVNLNCAVQALRFKDSFTFKTPESVRKLSFLLFTPEMQAEAVVPALYAGNAGGKAGGRFDSSDGIGWQNGISAAAAVPAICRSGGRNRRRAGGHVGDG